MQVAHEVVAFIEPYIALYGAFAILVLVFLESLGAPVPGESALIAASLIASRGDISIVHLLLAAVAGAILGDFTGYLIGRFGGRRLLLRYGWLIKLTPERLAIVENQFRSRGMIIVFFARFVVLLRQLNGLVAGSMAMPWPRFLVANALGGLAWASTWVLGPYFFASLFTGGAR